MIIQCEGCSRKFQVKDEDIPKEGRMVQCSNCSQKWFQAPAKIQSTITDLLPFPPILTKDQCEILSEADNIVSNNHLTLKDLDIEPSDVEEEMKKWLWRYKDGGQFAKA